MYNLITLVYHYGPHQVPILKVYPWSCNAPQLSEYYVVTRFHNKKFLSCVVLHYWTQFFVFWCACVRVCVRARARARVCVCMHTYLPHCVETGKTKGGQATKAVSSFLRAHLSGLVTA